MSKLTGIKSPSEVPKRIRGMFFLSELYVHITHLPKWIDKVILRIKPSIKLE